jgi:putative N6-adenine-specific DNA methylase
MKDTYTLLIPAQGGLESVVARQLVALGYPDAPATNGRLVVEDCTQYDIANLNMFLRSGERVLISLAAFPCVNFDQLYEGIRAIEWEHFLTADSNFIVETKSIDSVLFAHHSIQGVGKKAIVDRLTEKFHTTLSEDGARTVVEIDLTSDVATINIDTTGDGLFKRGYRTLSYTAPLKETLAAALIDLTYWNKDRPFADIFCGSGTLPIEAALKAQNIAPGIRRNFDFMDWQFFDITHHDRVYEKAKDEVLALPLDIHASDINPKAVSMAEFHAKRMGVDKYIRFSLADAKDFTSDSSFGVDISNIPYGERLSDSGGVKEIARMLGTVYKKLDKWNFCILTPNQDFEHQFGRHADKKRKLYNAGIMCSYYTFSGGTEKKPDFADRKPQKSGNKFKKPYGEKREYGDRKPRAYGDRKPREFGDKKREFGDRKQREFGDKKPRTYGDKPKRDYADKPKREYGETKPREYVDKPKREYGDKPKYTERPTRQNGSVRSEKEHTNPYANYERAENSTAAPKTGTRVKFFDDTKKDE